jgi:tetratricopeptide (TPR) repeat protein
MKKRYKFLIAFVLLIIVFVIYFKVRVTLNPPDIANTSVLTKQRTKLTDNFYVIDKTNFLKKNKYGLWELYVSGNDFDLGVKNGKLTKELAEYQEEAFVKSLKSMVPSDFYLNFLKYFVAWFDRDIDQYIPVEYQKEIYGISLNASKKFDFIAPNYQRILNYHAAHDIGHMVQNMHLVACTAFGVRNSRSKDRSLLVGRNMDFYVSDQFAENKIIAFYKPQNGYPFAYITWAGLIGVISGMNNQGLTITLNSAKSDIPSEAKMPVSILARKILQYASTIDEALAIAKTSQTFVSEAFFISSANDNDFAIIEKSLDTTILYRPEKEVLILTNHFQSKAMSNRPLTIENKKETETVYRWKRVKQLLGKIPKHSVQSFVDILRNQKGLNDKNIGMGNEMAINQLIAHHSVVFKPQQRQLWISVGPYTLGKYIAYDLNRIFSDSLDFRKDIFIDTLCIAEDSFLHTKEYQNFVTFKSMTNQFKNALNSDKSNYITTQNIEKYKHLNPNFYYTYFILGECYQKLGDIEKAKENYTKALEKDIPKENERNRIKKKLNELND